MKEALLQSSQYEKEDAKVLMDLLGDITEK
jgi:hypothetical protein